MTSTRLEELREQIVRRMGQGVKLGLDGSIGLGLFTPEGRQVGAQVFETNTEQLVVVTDGGETWADLWTGGCVDDRPSEAVRAKIEQFCSSYRLRWDAQSNSIVCATAPSEIADAALRVAACSIAIDGWRALLSSRTGAGRVVRVDAIMRDVEDVARERNWLYTARPDIRGRHRTWRANAALQRRGARVAVTVLEEARVESAVQRAFGWLLDTEEPVVFVAAADIANDVERDLGVEGRVAVVPKRGVSTPLAIVDAAEKVAETALAAS